MTGTRLDCFLLELVSYTKPRDQTVQTTYHYKPVYPAGLYVGEGPQQKVVLDRQVANFGRNI
jgi:hypothetical protein